MDLRPSFELSNPGTPLAFLNAINETLLRGLRHHYEGYRETDTTLEEVISEGTDLLAWNETEQGPTRAVLEWDDSLVYLTRWPATGSVNFMICSNDQGMIEKIKDALYALLPPRELTDDGTATITFWTLNNQRAAEARNRTLRVAPWSDINKNYPRSTRDHIDRLMTVQPPFDAGRLILLHGQPGTGKTYVIRSLAKEWLPWCDTHYIVDPENFFGEAHYMLSVILDTDTTRTFRATKTTSENALILNGIDRFRLLVIEDSDEFLRIDAKEKSGQALSRLLNTADGLVGQGLNFLFLITTNVSLANIHPAVSRTGRCVANLAFDEFNALEATEWLGRSAAGGTLADLYDQRRTQHQIATPPGSRPGQYV